MTNKEFILKVLHFIKPKFYDKITWTLIISGLGLFTTPLFEKLLSALIEKYANVKILDENASNYGLIIILLGLVYNITAKLIEYKIVIIEREPSPEQKLHKQLDLNLLRRIREILPSNGSIAFIKRNNFAGFSFDWDEMEQLHAFITETEKPEFRFIDSELETFKESLSINIRAFLNKLASNSFYVNGSSKRASIPEDWEISQPDRFFEVVDFLDEKKANAWSSYNELINIGRRKLGD